MIRKRKRQVRWIDGTPTVMIDNQTVQITRLLGNGDGNTKLAKNGKFGTYQTVGLSLSPSDENGIGNVCPNASNGCRESCLNDTGMAIVFEHIKRQRIAKTIMWYRERQWFLDQLAKELRSAEKKAERKDRKLACRLNVFSDIAFERYAISLENEFSDIEFYDYTKNVNRAGQVLRNYWVTFSRSETNDAECRKVLKDGGNVATVFDSGMLSNERQRKQNQGLELILPKTWHGFPVIDGDDTDLRFTDRKGVVIGLWLKAGTRADYDNAVNSGFAVKTLYSKEG